LLAAPDPTGDTKQLGLAYAGDRRGRAELSKRTFASETKQIFGEQAVPVCLMPIAGSETWSKWLRARDFYFNACMR
jgi:hypothetical protein